MDTTTLAPRLNPPIDETQFVKLAGPYRQYETNFLQNAIRQLGTIAHAVSRDKYGLWLWRSRDGYIDSYDHKTDNNNTIE